MKRDDRRPKPAAIECTEAEKRGKCAWPICDCACGEPPRPIFAEVPNA